MEYVLTLCIFNRIFNLDLLSPVINPLQTTPAQNRFKCKQGNLVIPPTGATYKKAIGRDHCYLFPYEDEKYCFIGECI